MAPNPKKDTTREIIWNLAHLVTEATGQFTPRPEGESVGGIKLSVTPLQVKAAPLMAHDLGWAGSSAAALMANWKTLGICTITQG